LARCATPVATKDAGWTFAVPFDNTILCRDRANAARMSNRFNSGQLRVMMKLTKKKGAFFEAVALPM